MIYGVKVRNVSPKQFGFGSVSTQLLSYFLGHEVNYKKATAFFRRNFRIHVIQLNILHFNTMSCWGVVLRLCLFFAQSETRGAYMEMMLIKM